MKSKKKSCAFLSTLTYYITSNLEKYLFIDINLPIMSLDLSIIQ